VIVSQLVIVGEVIDSRPMDETERSTYHVRVTEVIKADRSVKDVGSIVEVRRTGGTREMADHILVVKEHFFNSFEVGQRYLLFLLDEDGAQVYSPVNGPTGAYRIANGRLISMGMSTMVDPPAGKMLDQLVSELRPVLQQEAQSPQLVVEGMITVEREAPPGTLKKLWTVSHLVCVGEVVDSSPMDLNHDSTYRIRVSDVVKADGRVKGVGSLVEIHRRGGWRKNRDYISVMKEDDFDPFEARGQYVLFLYWNDSIHRYDPVNGPNGTYKIENGRIKSTGSAILAEKLDDTPLVQFLADLRKLAQR